MSTTVGVGMDLVDVGRFATALRRRPRLAGRLFTVREREDAGGRPERLAARFAAKEATWKSLGVGLGSVGFHDVEVQRTVTGAPVLHVSGAAAALASQRGVTSWQVSLSHTAATAGAFVIGSSA